MLILFIAWALAGVLNTSLVMIRTFLNMKLHKIQQPNAEVTVFNHSAVLNLVTNTKLLLVRCIPFYEEYSTTGIKFYHRITATSWTTTTTNKVSVSSLVCSTLPLISRPPSGCMNGSGRSIHWPCVPTHCPCCKQQRPVCSADCITTPLTSRATGLRALMQLCNTSPYTESGYGWRRMNWMWQFVGLLSYPCCTELKMHLVYSDRQRGAWDIKKHEKKKNI